MPEDAKHDDDDDGVPIEVSERELMTMTTKARQRGGRDDEAKTLMVAKAHPSSPRGLNSRKIKKLFKKVGVAAQRQKQRFIC